MKRGTFQRDTPQLGLVGVAEETNVGVGDEADFYPTPAWATQAILRRLRPTGPVFRILDPCAGDGAMLRAAAEMWPGIPMSLRGLEIHDGRAQIAIARGDCTIETRDALDQTPWPDHDLSLSNPPFKLAEVFVRRAIMERGFNPQKRAAVLLRLAFLESAERVELHRAHPADVYVFANRPCFIDPQAWRPCPKCKGGAISGAQAYSETSPHGRCKSCDGKGEVKGGTDSTAYAWFCYPGEGRWFVLDDRDPAKKPARRRS